MTENDFAFWGVMIIGVFIIWVLSGRGFFK